MFPEIQIPNFEAAIQFIDRSEWYAGRASRLIDFFKQPGITRFWWPRLLRGFLAMSQKMIGARDRSRPIAIRSRP